jgi:hypothetical protein
MNKKQKQQPAKRKYVKKSDKWTRKQTINAIKNIELIKPEATTPKKDKELETLAMICSVFDNLNDEQKQRFLKFLCGRYYDFM